MYIHVHENIVQRGTEIVYIRLVYSAALKLFTCRLPCVLSDLCSEELKLCI